MAHILTKDLRNRLRNGLQSREARQQSFTRTVHFRSSAITLRYRSYPLLLVSEKRNVWAPGIPATENEALTTLKSHMSKCVL